MCSTHQVLYLEHGAERLFGPGPHLPPLPLQPPHPLLPPLGPHCSSSLLEQPGGDQETKEVTVEHRGQYMDLELDGLGSGFSLGLSLLGGLVLLALALLLNLRRSMIEITILISG